MAASAAVTIWLACSPMEGDGRDSERGPDPTASVGTAPASPDAGVDLVGDSGMADTAVSVAKDGARIRESDLTAAHTSDGKAPAPSRAPVELRRRCGVATPAPIGPGQEFELQVLLTDDVEDPAFAFAVEDPDDAPEVSLRLPAANGPWPIDVSLIAKGFEILGPNMDALLLDRTGTSTPASFRLRAPERLDPGRTYAALITLSSAGNFLARLVHVLPVRGSPVESPPPTRPLPLALDRAAPDLTLILTTLGRWGSETRYRIESRSPRLQGAYQDVSFPEELFAWIESRLRRTVERSDRGRPALAEPPAGDGSLKGRLGPVGDPRARMRGFGRELWERAAPSLLRDSLERLAELGVDAPTIEIACDDPAIPFELMWPEGAAAPLGTTAQVTRVHLERKPGVTAAPPRRVAVREVVALAPAYSGTRGLPNRDRELRALRDLPGFREIPATAEAVEQLLKDPPDGVVHFGGHGVRSGPSDDPSYDIELEQGSIDLLSWRGSLTRDAAAHPLLFLNACDVGRAHAVAGFVEGWAPTALDGGFSGAIGALWPVRDEAAARAAEIFYGGAAESLARSEPVRVAELLRRVRAEFDATGDPSYLAYVQYGSPLLELTAGS